MFHSRRYRSRRSPLTKTGNPPETTAANVPPGGLTVPRLLGEYDLPAISKEFISSSNIDYVDDQSKPQPPASNQSLDKPLAKDQDTVEDTKVKFKAKFKKSSPIWGKYMKISEAEDKDVLDELEGICESETRTPPYDFNVELTPPGWTSWRSKAGLFSAISTGFLLESSRSLQPNPAVVTIQAIQDLISVVQAGMQAPRNSSSPVTTSLGAPFQPSMITVWVNCLWFFSLGLSISVSLFAMLAKQWCYMSRSKHSGTPRERAVERQEAWDALHEWRVELLIEQLPTVMRVSLMTFFISLVLYLSEIHAVTMIVTTIPIGVTVLAYGVLKIVPLWSRTFPMVTPFTQILQASSWHYTKRFLPWVRPYLQDLRDILHIQVEKWTHTFYTAGSAIRGFLTIINPSRFGNRDHVNTTRPSHVWEQWALSRCSKPVEEMLPYPCSSEGQRHVFWALISVLQYSNEKTNIEDLLEYVEEFPGMILDSIASGKPLFKVTTFPDLTPKEVQSEIDDIKNQGFNTTTCLPWLERHAVKIVFVCSPRSGGFALCQELYKWVLSEVSVPTNRDHEVVHSTLWWIFLNLVIDAATEYKTFWPSLQVGGARHSPDENVAKCDSALALHYFRDPTLRETNSLWLKVVALVGLSGLLNVPTYYKSEDMQPDLPQNHRFYASLLGSLRVALAPASQPSTSSAEDSPE